MDDTQNPQNQPVGTDNTQNTPDQNAIPQNTSIQNTPTEEINKKMEAVLAMEGEEGKARREREEREKKEAEMVVKYEEEKGSLNERLKEIAKLKEDFELHWVDLSEKKDGLQKLLDPILTGEANAEKDVQAKNQEEHATDIPTERQGFEKQRQALEVIRIQFEKEKWVIEDKMSELEKEMNDNKVKYQELLREEYSIIDKVKEIDKNIESLKK